MLIPLQFCDNVTPEAGSQTPKLQQRKVYHLLNILYVVEG